MDSDPRIARARKHGAEHLPGMRAAELLERARRHCAPHRHAPGVCRRCLLAEMEAMLLERNPELRRGDAHDLMEEWVRRVGELEH